MKKLFLSICLAVLTIGAYASNDVKTTDVAKTSKESKVTKVKTAVKVEKKFVADYSFTSSCGEVWDVTASPGLSLECHQALWQKMEDACGTTTDYVEVQAGIDC